MNANDEATNLRNQLDYAERRVAALTAELDRVQRLLDRVSAQGPTGDAVNGKGISAMASKAGFHHSYGNSIWVGREDYTEAVYRFAMMVAQAENAECAKFCEDNQVYRGSKESGFFPFYKEHGGRHEGMEYAVAIRNRWKVKP